VNAGPSVEDRETEANTVAALHARAHGPLNKYLSRGPWRAPYLV